MLGNTALEAHAIVTRKRDEEYGDPVEQYLKVAEAFNTLTDQDLTAQEVLILMLVIKVYRECNNHSHDNCMDICGYADLLNHFYEETEEEE